MKDRFLKLHNLLAGIRPERQTIKGQMAALEADLKKYQKAPEDWTYQIQQAKSQIAALQAQTRAKNQDIYKGLLEAAQELEGLLAEEMAKPIDLTDAKLTNALQIASMANLDHAQATSLAEQFRGNFAALQLLQGKFEERQIASGIDQLMVDPSRLKSLIENSAYNISLNDASPTSLLIELGKTAKQLNIELPAVEGDLTGSLYRGAGLPEPAQSAAAE